MKKSSLIRTIASLVILAVMAALVFWYVGHRPIAYHNSTLRSLIGSASQLEVSRAPHFGADGLLVEPAAAVIITDRSEIDRILRCFELPLSRRASGLFHECGGHLVIRIKSPEGTESVIRYDHGKMFHPISKEGEYPGYCHLPVETCQELNGIFIVRGFSQRDIGF